MADFRSLNILEAAELLGGSTRLVNGLRSVEGRNLFPLPTVADYLNSGSAAEEMLLSVPNIGTGSVRELWRLLSAPHSPQQILGTQAHRNELAPKAQAPSIAPADHVPLQAWIPNNPNDALEQLKAKERDVLTRRFGIGERSEETLAEIGASMGVTRERIRQLEEIALLTLRKRYGGTFRAFLDHHASSIWKRLSADSMGAAANHLAIEHCKLSPMERLATAVLRIPITNVLSTVARPVENGWILVDISEAALEEARAELVRLETSAVLPTCIEAIALLDRRALNAAVELAPNLVRFNGYLLRKPLNVRMRRTTRTHLLLREYPGEALSIRHLLAIYRARHTDDPCSSRDLVHVMGESRHLFLNLYEEGWMAIGAPPLIVSRVSESASCPIYDCSEQEPSQAPQSTAPTIAGVLRQILRQHGPLGFDELRHAFIQQTYGSYSPGSVGPVLIANADFVRLAPGTYGLEEQLSDRSMLSRGRALLCDERQLHIYCLARKAHEPFNLYALWGAETEKMWAEWALLEGHTEALSALLSIADIGAWPGSPTERNRWMSRKNMSGAFHLFSQNPLGLTERIPTYIDVLRVAVAARRKGGISWISANRVRGLRIDDRHAHSVLAFLVWLGVIRAATHWQDWHEYEPSSSSLVSDVLDTYQRSGGLTWPSHVYRREVEASSPTSIGWLSKYDLPELVRAVLHFECEKEPPNSEDENLDQLMERVLLQRSIRRYGIT